MARINLRELFPEYEADCYVTVPDSMAEAFVLNMTKEIADVYMEAHREESAYIRRRSRNKAFYSTDSGEWLESEGRKLKVNQIDDYHSFLVKQQLHDAIDKLPDKQAKRIYDHYILGRSKSDIARSEGVNEIKVRKAIERGLESLKKTLKNFSD